MHILSVLGAAIGVAIFFLWRAQQASYAVRELASAADDVRGLFRRRAWRRKVNVNPLDMVEDPREAATAMMVLVAEADGELTQKERLAILALMSEHFGATSRQGEELLSRGRWLVRQKADASEVFRRLAPSVRRACERPERRELIGMLKTVARAEGRADVSIEYDIAALSRQLDL